MKRMNSLIRLVLTVAVIMTSTTGFAQQRSMDEVMSIAHNHLQNRTSRTGQRLAPPLETATTLRASQLFPTALRMSNAEAFYVLSYPQSDCFVMVSGDERMSPVLAYSNEHSFDFDNMAPQTKAFIEAYVNQAKALESNTPHKLNNHRAPDDVTPTKVDQLLTTTWSQRAPYNNRCPVIGTRRTLTGCVATAISQLMNYYKYPKVGVGNLNYTTETAQIPISIDYSTIYFSWDNMLDRYNGGYNDEEANAVSELMYAAGTSVHMDYGLDASSSNLGDAAYSLIRYFKYDTDIIDVIYDRMNPTTFHQFLIQELQSGRPIPCAGNNEKGDGHAFIIDGMTPDGDSAPFYHINWGWGGSDDGNFKIVEAEYHKSIRALLYCQPENNTPDIATFIQAREIAPSITRINPELANSVTVRLKEVYNSKQGIFNGMLNVYMVSEDGTRTKIGERGVQFEHPYFYPIEINCKVPKDMTVGTYTLEVGATNMETSAAESLVYFAEDHPLTVTYEIVDYTPDVQVTKMDFIKSQMNDSTVCVELKNFINMGAEPFKGDVSIALASENNKVLCMLGTPIKVKDPLNTYYYKETLGYLKGVIPDSIPDEVYHIIAMARQDGFEGWGMVRQYNIQGNTIINPDQELFLTIQIENGKIKTDGIVVPQKYFADIETTQMILNEEKCKDWYFSISIPDYANLSNETFNGTLSLALADDDNNVILTFGKTVSISNLGSYNFRGGTVTFSGEMPDTVPDGHYRLCIAAQQKGFSNWTPMSQMMMEDYVLTETNLECFFDLWIIKGKPTFSLYKREDVNHDGIVDTQDVLAIYQFMQNATGNEINPVEDVNSDGVVDTQDVLIIYTYMQEN